MSISKSLRYEIMRRDNHTCRYCGGTPPEVRLTIDHVTPATLGGTDDPGNLVVACADCNAGKSSIPPGAPLVDDVKQEALRWAEAVRRAAEEVRKDSERLLLVRDLFIVRWDEWENKLIGNKHYPIPGDWAVTIDRFHEAGLSQEVILECLDIAICGPAYYSEKWRYFCGVAYKRIAKLHDMAKEILAADEVGIDGA